MKGYSFLDGSLLGQRTYLAHTRQCKVLKDLLSSSRSNYYSNLVAENQSNMRSLFAVFSKLLHRRHEAKYPKHDSSSSLANDFVLFFGDMTRSEESVVTLIKSHLWILL